MDHPAATPTASPPRAPDPPAPARGVELLGAVTGSGYRDAPALVRRPDGQILQLTPTLYAVLEAIDGRRGPVEIAARLRERLGVIVAPDDVASLVDTKLRPLGVLRAADGSEPTPVLANPLLALRGRAVVAAPATTDRLAAPFARLFAPAVVLAVVAAFAAVNGWLLVDKGLAAGARQAIYEPGLLLLVFGLTLLSAGFHELGHAAACRYGGARPGAMGVGLYLVWPAFYTDVSDSYRLDRRGRLRVDLGGIYFNAVFAVGAFALWWVTGWDAVLVVVPLQLLQMLRQLVPFVRFDGYHILADLVGVPDLFARIKPTLVGLLPSRWGSPEGRVLKPWARAVVVVWVLTVVPVLAASLAIMAVTLPRLAATAWDSLALQASDVVERWAAAELAGLAVGVLSMLAIAVPVLGVTYLLARVAQRTVRGAWRATADNRGLRAVALLAGAAILLSLTSAWWPDGQYEPIRTDERATLADAARSIVGLRDSAPADASMASVGTAPVSPDPTMTATAIGEAAEAAFAPTPLLGVRHTFGALPPPGPDDNQALAVNYEDGSSVFDLAFSLLWATDGVVDEVNEAYALASCHDCLTMAVAFQLVLAIGDMDTVVPQNHAVAVNALCAECVTHAIAVQLILTLAEEPSQQVLDQLDQIWTQLDDLAADIESSSPEEIRATLLAVETDILGLFAPEPTAASTSSSARGTSSSSTTSTRSADEQQTTSTTQSRATASTDSTSTTSGDPASTTTTGGEGSTTTTTTSDDGASTTSTTVPDGTTTTTTEGDGTSTTSTTAPDGSTSTTTGGDEEPVTTTTTAGS